MAHETGTISGRGACQKSVPSSRGRPTVSYVNGNNRTETNLLIIRNRTGLEMARFCGRAYNKPLVFEGWIGGAYIDYTTLYVLQHCLYYDYILLKITSVRLIF